MTPTTKRRLVSGVVVSLLLPTAIGWWAKQNTQPGIHADPERAALIIDFMTLGAIGFGLTAMFTILLGSLIVASMKGPVHHGDEFAAGDPSRVERLDHPSTERRADAA